MGTQTKEVGLPKASQMVLAKTTTYQATKLTIVGFNTVPKGVSQLSQTDGKDSKDFYSGERAPLNSYPCQG